MIYTLTFNPAIDHIVRLDRPLQPGTVNRAKEEAFLFGGKGINVSLVLRTLETESIALGFIAGYLGDALEKGLQSEGLQTDLLRVKHGLTRVNLKLKDGTETELNGIGPTIMPEDLEKLYAQLEDLEAGDILVLSGSIPGCLPKDTYARLCDRCSKQDLSLIVDAEGPLLLGVLPYRPFLIKPNREELSAITGQHLSTDEQLIAGARSLQKQGARNVLVSLAGDGALLLDEAGGVHRASCPRGKVINSVGAGDSMLAGFLAGWLKTADYASALRLGIAAGSATAFSLGLASKADIEALLDRV